MRLSDKAYIISLQQHTHKLEATTTRLEKAGFKDIEPFVANQPSKQELVNYCRHRRVPKWAGGRKLRHKGELGCLQSHRELLKTISDSKRGAFIFEDDIRIHKNFRWLFANASSATAGCNWTYLGCSQIECHKIHRTKPTYSARLSLGTFAYWVSDDGAKAILAGIDKWPIPIDQYFARHLQRLYQVRVCYPYLMIADVSNSATGNKGCDVAATNKRYGWKPEDYE